MMKISPRYRFFRVISGGDLIDIDIFQYPHKTTVVISMIYYKQEHILITSISDHERKSAIRLANLTFQKSKKAFEQKHSIPPVLN
jgi:hypothetical protein